MAGKKGSRSSKTAHVLNLLSGGLRLIARCDDR